MPANSIYLSGSFMIAAIRLLLALCCLTLSVSSAAEPLTLRIFQTDSRYQFRTELLQLALEKTRLSDGDFIIQAVAEPMSFARGLRALEAGMLDVVSLAVNSERNTRFQAIEIPLLSGILGYRIALTHKDEAGLLSAIETLDELRLFTAGFGSHWADMKILQSNQLPVIGITRYENLFTMLAAKRFDYFPRGINEIWQELEDRKQQFPGLVAESSFALYYPYPVYFYVNKENKALADRIRRGLEAAFKDGSYRELFLQYHREIIRQAQLKKRRIFILSNPDLPTNSPRPDSGWWMKLPIGSVSDE